MLLCSFHLIPEGFTSGENTSKVVYARSHRFGSIEEHEARHKSFHFHTLFPPVSPPLLRGGGTTYPTQTQRISAVLHPSPIYHLGKHESCGGAPELPKFASAPESSVHLKPVAKSKLMLILSLNSLKSKREHRLRHR